MLTFPPGNGVSLRMKSFLKEEISTKRCQNVEEIHSKRKMSMKWPQNVEKTKPQGAEGAQMQQKTPSLWDGVFYLNGSDELTAEVVEQNVL